MKVLSVNITATILEGEWIGSQAQTGIDKRPIFGAVRFENEQVHGDVIGDKNAHGGYDQAVYAYAREDADWWEQEIALTIDNGRFGENLTTQGVDVSEAVIGERWKIGSVILEVSQPRIPCRTFAGFWERPTLIKEFMRAGKPGTYLRIIQEGEISAGESIEVISRPKHLITIADIYAAKNGERSKVEEIALVDELSPKFKEWVNSIRK
ncbi:MAG: MOSC domain-containing protein [Streptomycetaceae bacterium]|nr:MAG: MOSC domain-containing protein [Streptomycetaceae bacterium]